MKKVLFSVFALSFIWNGCTTSHITSEWKAPDVHPQAYNKIMVCSMIREADRSIGEKMEQHLMNDLKGLGYEASSAYQQYGPKGLLNLTEEQVYQKLRNDSIDAVVTIVLLDKEKERYYGPHQAYYSPYVIYYGNFYGYYNTMSWRVGDPGYYSVSTRYFWESNLYDLDKGKLLYSVQTQSFNPSSKESMAHEYGKMILQSMVNGKVLEKQSGVPRKVM